MRRRLLALAAALAVLCTLTLPALAAETPSVQLDGETLALTPELVDRRAYLPYDALFAALGAQAVCEDGTVTARRDGASVTLPAAYVRDGVSYVSVRSAAEGRAAMWTGTGSAARC